MANRVVSSGDWRQQEQSSSGSRWGAIVLLGLLISGLIGFLIYKWLPPNPPNVAIHMMGVPDYSTDVPGIPFVQEDWTLFQEDSLPFASGQIQKDELTEPGEIENLASALTSFFEQGDEQDIAIVYVSAHGVTQVEVDPETQEIVANAQLIGSTSSNADFEFASADVLISQIQGIKAETKLLLLDTAYMGENFGLGMGVNEFVYQLHRAVAEIEDRNLWIIHSTGLLQMSHISFREKQSVFAKAVLAAFTRLGDPTVGEKNEPIYLSDFYLEIASNCQAYAPRSVSYMQTPILMRGGTGFVPLDPGQESADVNDSKSTLVFYRSTKVPEPEEDSKEGEDKDKGDEESKDQASRTRSAAVPLAAIDPAALLGRSAPRSASLNRAAKSVTNRVPAAAQDDDEEQPGAEGGAAEQESTATDDGDSQKEEPEDPLEKLNESVEITELQKSMNRVMVLRDQLGQRTDQRQWLPVDYAPHLWDQLLMRLARLDERAMFVTDESDRTAFVLFETEIKGFETELEALINVLNRNQVFNQRQFTDSVRTYNRQEVRQLFEAWHEFTIKQSGQLKNSWESADAEVVEIVSSIKEYYGILGRLKYYQMLSEDLSLFENPIAFNSQLTDLIREVKERKPYFTKVDFGNAQIGLGDDVAAARAAINAVRDKENRLNEAVLKTFNDQVASKVASDDRTEYLIAERLAIIYLQSPLIPMVDEEPEQLSRIYLLEFLEGLRQRSVPKSGDPSEDDWATRADFAGIGHSRWSAVDSRLTGRKRLFSVSTEGTNPEPLGGPSINPPTASRFESSIEDTLQVVRAESLALHDAYEGLFQVIPTSVDSGSTNDPVHRRFASAAIVWDAQFLKVARGSSVFNTTDAALSSLRFQQKVGKERVVFANELPSVFEMQTDTRTVAVDLIVDNYKSSELNIKVEEIDSENYEIRYRQADGSFSSEAIRENGTVFPIRVVDAETGREDLEKNLVRLEFQVKTKPGVNRATLPDLYDQSVTTMVLSTKGNSADAERSDCQIRVRSPLPQFIDLIVRNPVTDVWEPSNDQGQMNTRTSQERNVFPSKSEVEIVQVHPFTNRAAPYELLLVNRSGVPVEARVELYNVRRPGAYPGLRFDRYPLLPGRVSELNSRTPDPNLVRETVLGLDEAKARFMPSVTSQFKMVPFAVSQLETLPEASQAFPAANEVFSADEASQSAKKMSFGQPISIPSAEEGQPATSVPNDPQENVDVTNGILCRILIKGWDGDSVVEQFRWIEMTPTLWNVEDRYIDIDSVTYDANSRRIEAELRTHGFAKSQAQPFRLPWEFLQAVEAKWVDVDPEKYPNETFDQIAAFESTRSMTRRWRVPDLGEGAEIRNWPVWFDVDGYPRLFHYRLTVGDTNNKAVNWRDSAGRCRITRLDVYNEEGLEEPSSVRDLTTSLPTGEWIGECHHVVVHYEIDGPLGGMLTLSQDRLVEGREEYIRTFTRDTGRQAENELVYYLDRDITYQAGIGKTGALELTASVSDLTREFEVSRIGRNTPIPFVAELNVPGNEPIEQTTIIGIDTRKPKIDQMTYPGDAKQISVALNKTVELTIKTIDKESGIPDSGIELYLNLERNNVGRLVYDEGQRIKVRPVVTEEDQDLGTKTFTWLIEPEAAKLGKGNYSIAARVKDRVGLYSEADSIVELTVLDPVVEPDPEEMERNKPKKLYDIELKISTQRGQARVIPIDGSVQVKIEVEGPKKANATPGEKNDVRLLRQLPAGTYTIKAEAERNGITYAAETQLFIDENDKRDRIPFPLKLNEQRKDD